MNKETWSSTTSNHPENFDGAVQEWDNNPTINKTWTNIKTFIPTEYACKNK
jgi:hypothetical protein